MSGCQMNGHTGDEGRSDVSRGKAYKDDILDVVK